MVMMTMMMMMIIIIMVTMTRSHFGSSVARGRMPALGWLVGRAPLQLGLGAVWAIGAVCLLGPVTDLPLPALCGGLGPALCGSRPLLALCGSATSLALRGGTTLLTLRGSAALLPLARRPL